jgi:hypothetical protein
MADQLILARQFDDNGNPGSGYVASFFLSGTTTPATVYTDTGATIPAGTSVTANAAGRFAQTFHPGGSALKCVITDALAATVETIDPVPTSPLSASAAVNVAFSPTGPLPFTNVQAAIEGSVAAASTGFNAFGLGITGNAPLLANLDATNTGSGSYRFDATTTGTFPSGVVAADTGHIVINREASASASMWLYHDTTDRIFIRRMASTAWGAWQENVAASAIETTLTSSATAVPRSSSVFNNLGWQPYNGTTGILYDVAVSGATAAVEATFEDGYEYLIVGNNYSFSATGRNRIRLYRDTSAAYTAYLTPGTADSTAAAVRYLRIICHIPRAVLSAHSFELSGYTATGVITDTYTIIPGGDPTGPDQVSITHATPQKIGRLEISGTAGNIDAGKFFLYRRRVAQL